MGSFSDLPAPLQNAIYYQSVVIYHKEKLTKVLVECRKCALKLRLERLPQREREMILERFIVRLERLPQREREMILEEIRERILALLRERILQELRLMKWTHWIGLGLPILFIYHLFPPVVKVFNYQFFLYNICIANVLVFFTICFLMFLPVFIRSYPRFYPSLYYIFLF